MTFFKIAFGCLLVIAIINTANTLVEMSLRSEVYACTSDKDKLPPDAVKQCERLTKGQWWHK